MDKTLEELIQRVKTWPTAAREEAIMALTEIDGRIADTDELSREEQEKLTALREMINKSIAEGGDVSDGDIEESIRSRLDAWEKSRKSA